MIERLRRIIARHTLFGWPPLASHLTTFLLGLGMAQLPGSGANGAPGGSGGGKIGPARSAVLSLPESVGMPAEARPLRAGDEVVLVRRGEDAEAAASCVVAAPPLRVEARVPRIAVRFHVSKGREIFELGRALEEPKLMLVRSEAAFGWKACERQGKVSYGTP